MEYHPFDGLSINEHVQLIFTPCPGTKAVALSESVATLKQAGASMLITLMDDSEMLENNAFGLPDECKKQGIEWIQLPIADDAAPSDAFEKNWKSQKDNILNAINSKRSIAVHCKGGSGRTGLVIALILSAYGWSTEKIIEEVQRLRPKSLKNPVQLAYFKAHI